MVKEWDILVSKVKEGTIRRVLKCRKMEATHKVGQCMADMVRVVKAGANNNFNIVTLYTQLYVVHNNIHGGSQCSSAGGTQRARFVADAMNLLIYIFSW